MLADAGDQVVLAVAVAAVSASRAQLMGLGVHDRVHDALGDAPHAPRFTDPSSNLGIAGCSRMLSARLPIAVFVLSKNPLYRNSRF